MYVTRKVITSGWGFAPCDEGREVEVLAIDGDDVKVAEFQDRIISQSAPNRYTPFWVSIMSFVSEFDSEETINTVRAGIKDELKKKSEVVNNREISGKVESDGGKSSYYELHIPDSLVEVIMERKLSGGAYIETEELIQYIFKSRFDFGNAFKSLVRANAIVDGGGKKGNSLPYEINKIKYSSDRIKEVYSE